jgi:hypothetical protein
MTIPMGYLGPRFGMDRRPSDSLQHSAIPALTLYLIFFNSVGSAAFSNRNWSNGVTRIHGRLSDAPI